MSSRLSVDYGSGSFLQRRYADHEEIPTGQLPPTTPEAGTAIQPRRFDMKAPSETTFQIAVLIQSPDELKALPGAGGIEWMYCKQSRDYSFEFYKGEEMVSSFDLEDWRLDLPNLLGIIVVGPADLFETIRYQWISKLPAAGVAFKHIPEFDEKAILSSAIECFAENLQSQRSHAGRAALDLAAYRSEFERLQHSFSRLEEHVTRQTFQRAAEIFEYPPTSATASGNSPVIQYLPVDSYGFSGFAVHVATKPAEAQPLRVTLRAIETGTLFGVWEIGAEVANGWVELALNRAIDEPALTLEAVFELAHNGGGWALSLGPPHPYAAFRARAESGSYLDAPMALRIFNAAPGVRVGATTGAIRPIDAPQPRAEFIPYEVYGTVTQVAPPVEDERPALVAFDREIGCITVHPRKGGSVTAARIDVAVPKDAWQVAAQIHLAHERSSTTHFGLLVCPPRDGSLQLARLDRLDAPSTTFSGWKSLSPLEKKTISVPVSASREERLSVFLVTRLSPEASPDFAWARFAMFEFSILPKPLADRNGTGDADKVFSAAVPGIEPNAGSV